MKVIKTLVGGAWSEFERWSESSYWLARALYIDADIYLMDDPLSAVDPAVSRHLFDKYEKYKTSIHRASGGRKGVYIIQENSVDSITRQVGLDW